MQINKEKAAEIKGFLDEREADYLYQLALFASKEAPVWKSAVIAGSQPFISAAPAK
jgi:hypothetical protein